MFLFVSFCMMVPIIYVVAAFITAHSANPKKQEEARQKAIAAGQVVTAKLIKQAKWGRTYKSGNDETIYYPGTYVYNYKGKEYKYKLVSASIPSQMTLYFLYKPLHAEPAGRIYLSRFAWLLCAWKQRSGHVYLSKLAFLLFTFGIAILIQAYNINLMY